METEQAAIDRHTDRITKKARRIVDEVLGGVFDAAALAEVITLRMSCPDLTDMDFFRLASVKHAGFVGGIFGFNGDVDAYFRLSPIDRRTKTYKQARKVVEWAVARFHTARAGVARK